LLRNKTENRSLAYSRYQNAIANLSDYLTVPQELLEEEQKNIALQFQQRITVVQLIKALGGGYCSMEVPLGCQ